MYKAILFDLDGTLTESGEGITKCVQYALEKLGRPESDLEKLKVFIGPPLMEQFMIWMKQLRAKQWNITESVILRLEYLRIVHTRGWKRCFRN